MKTDIIKIGNSKGIRIPKAILEQCGFNGAVEMQVADNKLILSKPVRTPREGWAEQIAESIKKYGIPELLFPDDMINEFDKTEWTWGSEEN
jgi:antitoxin MazE